MNAVNDVKNSSLLPVFGLEILCSLLVFGLLLGVFSLVASSSIVGKGNIFLVFGESLRHYMITFGWEITGTSR